MQAIQPDFRYKMLCFFLNSIKPKFSSIHIITLILAFLLAFNIGKNINVMIVAKTNISSFCEKSNDNQTSKKDSPVSKKNSLNEEEHDDQKKIPHYNQVRSDHLHFNLSGFLNLFIQLSKYQIYREIPSPPPNYNYFS